MEIAISRTDRYRGFSYSCPNCQTVLSVEMNPLTLKDDILGELQANLGLITESLEAGLSQKILAEVERIFERR